MKILEVKDLSLHYGDQSILKNISFSVEKGKIIGLLGPNGAGKSSILKILAGLVFPENGSVSIEGKSLKSFSELRSHCGYLIDAPSFYPYLSAIQNLKLIKKINKSSVDLAALLTMVGLGSVDGKKVRYFSMGMKQRLAIAQALLRSPRILILDEPFNGLDPNGFQDLIKLLEDLNKSGITIFISSHLLNELEQLSDHFILLHKGNIELDISKTNLLESKKRIAFTLENKPTKKVLEYFKELHIDSLESNKVIVHLDKENVAGVVAELVKLGCIPVEVETLTILQEKYLEITD